VASGVSELFLLFTFHKMNEREVATAAYDDARKALAETQAELKEAKKVVAEWRKLKGHEDWDEASSSFKSKTLGEWKKEIEKLEEKEKMLMQEVKKARASFDRVVSQGNSISHRSLQYSQFQRASQQKHPRPEKIL
jgi:multidrug efflux pump subunit AcrA (membrane-fusion protein)